MLLIAVPAMDLAAQQDPWSIAVEFEAGAFMPTRAFGKNSGGTDDPDLIFLQPSAKAGAVAIFGAGLRIQLPNPTMSIRLTALRTATGTVEGKTPACDVLDPTNPQTEDAREILHCNEPFTEDYTVSEFIARVQFKRLSDEGGRLRPTFDIGLGIRNYDFGGSSCLNDATVITKQAIFICEQSAELTVNQTKPLLMFGIGLEYTMERFVVFTRVHDEISPYGTSGVRGTESQNDVVATAGFSIKVR